MQLFQMKKKPNNSSVCYFQLLSDIANTVQQDKLENQAGPVFARSEAYPYSENIIGL